MAENDAAVAERDPSKTFAVALWDAFDDVVQRLVTGRHTLKDFVLFLKKLADVEDAYAKGMSGAYNAFKDHEEKGTLGSGYLQVKQRIEAIGVQHNQFAEDLRRVSASIEEFRAECLSDRNKLIERHTKITHDLATDTNVHAKAQARYIKACRDLQVAVVQEEASGAEGYTDKQRIQTSKAKNKAAKEQTEAETQYKSLCDALLQTQERHDAEIVAIMSACEAMENKRVAFLRDQFGLFHTHLESTSSNLQQALLMMQAVIDTIDVNADLDAFVAGVRPETAAHPPKVTFEAFDEPTPTGVKTIAPKAKGKGRLSTRSSKTVNTEDTPAAGGSGEASKALYDFVGDQEGELPFHVNDTIMVTSRDDSGWWHGTCNGVSGIFPAIYCDLGAAGGDGHDPADPTAAAGGDVAVHTAVEGGVVGRKCRALYDYSDPGSPDVLEIKANDVITIVVEAEGWYTGEDSEGKTGIFPANYVELID